MPLGMRTTMTALAAAALPALLAVLAGCGEQSPTPDAGHADGAAPVAGAPVAETPVAETPVAEGLAIEHDFGVIPHGESREFETELPLHELGMALVPLRVHLDCSCGRANLKLRREDGFERSPDGSGYAYNMPREDEKVFLHIEIDTSRKEAVDLAKTASRGYVMLQPADDLTGTGRKRWPFVVHFGIDAPVTLRPYAAFDFGRVPVCDEGSLLTTLRGDEQHPDMRFLSVTSSDPMLECTLEPGEDHTVLRARALPGRLGNHRALVQVETDLDDYTIALEAHWKVVPDIEATPVQKISFRAPLDEEQPRQAFEQQFVVVVDHDRRRTPEFAVLELVDEQDRDCSRFFATELEPIPGADRRQRLKVRYLGGLEQAFRGRIVLAKPGLPTGGPELPVELVLIPSRRP